MNTFINTSIFQNESSPRLAVAPWRPARRAALEAFHDQFEATMKSPTLDELLASLARDWSATFVSSDDVVLEALQTIAQQSGEPLTVHEVAKAVAVSRRTLERRFRAAVGCSIRQAITSAQLWRARRLLRETSLPVSEVAFASGFSYVDRLGKVFARVEGMTPTEYRAQAASTSMEPRLRN